MPVALIIGRQRLQGRRSIYPDRYLPSWISNGPLGLEIAEPSGRS